VTEEDRQGGPDAGGGPDGNEEADHTQDPRGADRSDQMPEDAPAGQTAGSEHPAGDERHAEAAGAGQAPDTTGDQSGENEGEGGEGSQSTGNPDAAG
jgi:hypothetical protein